MKERIYTIPITEAFGQDCECPLCICEKKLEQDALEYTLGPSMMEPDSRIETNRTGFCNKHFTRLYNMQQNRLALGLVIDTHMVEQNGMIQKIYEKYAGAIDKERGKGILESVKDSIASKKTDTMRFIEETVEKLKSLEKTCAVCQRIQTNMERFIDVTVYLFFKEPDFRANFMASKGFCLKHFEALLAFAGKELSAGKKAEFVLALLPLQLKNMQRVQDEVNHFTKMFDYRNQHADWKNSRDAVPRSIEKISGPCDLVK